MALKRIDSLKDDDRAFVSTPVIAEYLGTTTKFVRDLIDTGKLPARKLGRASIDESLQDHWFVLVSDLRKLVGSTE